MLSFLSALNKADLQLVSVQVYFTIPKLKDHFPRPSYCSVPATCRHIHNVFGSRFKLNRFWYFLLWYIIHHFNSQFFVCFVFLHPPSAECLLTITMKTENFQRPWQKRKKKKAIFPDIPGKKHMSFLKFVKIIVLLKTVKALHRLDPMVYDVVLWKVYYNRNTLTKEWCYHG